MVLSKKEEVGCNPKPESKIFPNTGKRTNANNCALLSESNTFPEITAVGIRHAFCLLLKQRPPVLSPRDSGLR